MPGPPPKDPARRARRNKDPIAPTTLRFVPGEQPALPDRRPEGDAWPARTVAWWAMWGESEQARLFTATDWSELLDTAILHARYWSGDVKMAGELRLRVAKFGATPEDRARLRITFAQADEADGGQPASAAAVRRRHAGLRAVPS
jgi:hypothetical protein